MLSSKFMKKLLLLLSISLGSFAACQLASAADITGTVNLQGTPPPNIPYTPMRNMPQVNALYPGKLPTTHFYVVGKNGGLGDVSVFLETADGKPITGKSTGASAKPAVLDQKGALYRPQILDIQTHQQLDVKNSDPFVHNVHTTPTNNPPANEVQMPGGPDLHFKYANPEMYITFRCDVHPWMFAWVNVFDNPYFSLTKASGHFDIKNVPPGTYTLVASHRKLGMETAKIVVDKKGVVHNFTFHIKKK